MEYLVCRWKDNSGYFITTRSSRETMISVLMGLAQEIESNVVKSFTNYTLADKYKKSLEQADKDIDRITNHKNTNQ